MKRSILLLLLIASLLPLVQSHNVGDEGIKSAEAQLIGVNITQSDVYDDYVHPQYGTVDVNQSLAFISAGDAGVQVYDISNTSSPEWLIDLWREQVYINSIIIHGFYGFVGHENGLWVVDLHDYMNPVIVNEIIDSAYDNLFINDTLLFATNPDGLKIIDISEPSNPVLLTVYSDNTSIKNINMDSIQVSGNFGYVTDCGNGLLVLDLTNPSVPQLQSKYDVLDTACASDVAINGSRLYLAYRSGGLVTLDISNPADPTNISTFQIDQYDDYRRVSVHGDYVLAGNGNSLRVLKPNANTDNLDLLVADDWLGPWSNMEFIGDDGIMTSGVLGIRILNLSNASQPELIGSDYHGYRHAIDVAVVDNKLITCSFDSIEVLDISSGFTTLREYPKSICLDIQVDNMALPIRTLGVSLGYGLQVLDVTDPLNIIKGGVYMYEPEILYNSDNIFYVSNEMVYIWNQGLEILDISSMDPILVGSDYTFGADNIRDLVVVGDLLAISTTARTLVYDISDPTNPLLVKELNIIAFSTELTESALFLSTSDLLVLDVANDFAIVGVYGRQGALFVNGSILYSGLSKSMMAYDVSNPLHPIELVVNTDIVGNPASNMAIIGNMVFGTYDFNGIISYSIEFDYQQVSETESTDTSSQPTSYMPTESSSPSQNSGTTGKSSDQPVNSDSSSSVSNLDSTNNGGTNASIKLIPMIVALVILPLYITKKKVKL